MDADELAGRVRGMCEEGRLPASEEGVHVGSSVGEGAPCDVCGERNERQAPDMVLRATIHRVDRSYSLHPRYFLAWRRHCGAKG